MSIFQFEIFVCTHFHLSMSETTFKSISAAYELDDAGELGLSVYPTDFTATNDTEWLENLWRECQLIVQTSSNAQQFSLPSVNEWTMAVS